MRHPSTLILLATALAACKSAQSDRAMDRGEELPTSVTALDVKVADIAGSPERYLGQTVSVTSEIDDVYSPWSFSLDEDAFLGGGIDNDLLVVARKGSGLIATEEWEDQRVQVIGTVGRWTVIEIERELGFDLDPQLEAEIERSGAVLLADSVIPLEE